MDNREISMLSNKYWSGRATEFSALRMKDYETPMRARLLEFIASVLPESKGIKALDVGCGAGFLTLLLLELGCAVTAVDFSDEMLEEAAQNCRDKGYAGRGAEFINIDAQNLSFADCSFDFVISRNVLWTLPDAASAYRGMFRVLRPGGILLNMDANYGKTFNAADARGETPVHPTQTLEQLRTRNRISRDLEVTKAGRPLWDLSLLWDCGASELRCIRNFENVIGIKAYDQASVTASANSSSEMFAVIAVK